MHHLYFMYLVSYIPIAKTVSNGVSLIVVLFELFYSCMCSTAFDRSHFARSLDQFRPVLPGQWSETKKVNAVLGIT